MFYVMQAVCHKIGIDVADRLDINSKKHKFLIVSAKEDKVIINKVTLN